MAETSALLRVAVIAALLAAGSCAPRTDATEPGAADRVVVRYPNPATFGEVQETVAARFETANPGIDVRFLAPAPDYDDMTQALLRGLMAGKAPDVAVLSFPGADHLGERGALRDLSATEWSRFLGGAAGSRYCAPFALSAPVIYVNADLMRRAGRDPADPPGSWQEVAALGRRLRAASGPRTQALWLPIDSLPDWTWQIFLNGRGGEVIDPSTGRVSAFRGPAAEAAMADVAAVARSGLYVSSSNQALQAFTAGRLAMLVGSNAVLDRVLAQTDGRFALGLWLPPLQAPGAGYPMGGNCVAMPVGGEADPAAAEAYVRALLAPETGVLVARATGYLPASAEARAQSLTAFPPVAREVLAGLSEDRLRPWRAYPGARGLRVPTLIRRTLERLALDPAADELDLLDRLARKVDTLTAGEPRPPDGRLPRET